MQTLSPPAAPPAGGCLYLWKTEVAVVVVGEEEQEIQVKFKKLLCRRMKGKKGKMKEGTVCGFSGRADTNRTRNRTRYINSNSSSSSSPVNSDNVRTLVARICCLSAFDPVRGQVAVCHTYSVLQAA